MMKYRYQNLNPDNTKEIAPKGDYSVSLFCVNNNSKPWKILMQVYTLTVKGRLATWCLISGKSMQYINLQIKLK